MVVAAVGAGLHRQCRQAAPAQQPGLFDQPALNLAAAGLMAHPGQQAALGAETVTVRVQAEIVVAQHGDDHSEQPQQHRQTDQQEQHADGRSKPRMPAARPRQHRLGGVRHHPPEALGIELPEHAEDRAHHHHAAIAGQTQPEQVRHWHLQIGRGRCWSVGATGGGGCGSAATGLADRLRQPLGVGQRQHPHLRFWPAAAAGRFQADLGDPEQAVQRRTPQRHVADSRQRQMADVALEQAAADHQFIGTAVEPVAEGEIAVHRGQRQAHRGERGGEFLPVAAAAEKQQQDQRQRELAQLRQQHEQPRPRMQPAFADVIGGRHDRSTGRHAGRRHARRQGR